MPVVAGATSLLNRKKFPVRREFRRRPQPCRGRRLPQRGTRSATRRRRTLARNC